MAAPLAVRLVVDSPRAAAAAQPVTVGVPFPRGALADPGAVRLAGPAGEDVLLQAAPLARHADGSVKWLLLDFVARDLAAGKTAYVLKTAGNEDGPAPAAGLEVWEEPGAFVIDTGAAVFRVGRDAVAPLLSGDAPADALRSREEGGGVSGKGPELLGPARVLFTDARGRASGFRVSDAALEAAGPVRATVRLEGGFGRGNPCRFVARLSFFAGTPLVRLRLTLHNPRRARHRGGLWDLGDPGSVLFRDLTLELPLGARGLAAGVPETSWRAEESGPWESAATERFELYQESSGGENWQSRTHVNRDGRVELSLRGYRLDAVHAAGGAERHGLRASPVVSLGNGKSCLTVAVPEFWQQFPKAVETAGHLLRVRLFPGQFGDLHELQGGEQKTHTVWLHAGPGEDAGDDASPLDWVHHPALALAGPGWYADSGAFPYLPGGPSPPGHPLDGYLGETLEGPKSLFARREVIDEYGWRNYGELHADHEEAYHDGPKPVVSHYNNQYDPVYGFLLQLCRTGDRRWWELLDPLARHVADIDVYHTREDRAAYNGGLFWFTDHYKDAATCTHRTYSRANRPANGAPYGGGPASCHNFATGLAGYYFLTGDPVARDAALGLADWVVDMDDGSLNVLGLLDGGPTGLASFTAEPDYHGPGRGPGLSVNALLDGWELTGRRRYLDKAEELIRRTVHPSDDPAARELLDIERRWSYTIYLAALDRFLRAKAAAGEVDRMYGYARAALLRYAEWMLEHERPYFDRAGELEYPTETWAAQELRKANVLRLAAAYAGEPLRGRLLRRGDELAERAWHDLHRFGSRHVARAVAIVLTEGTRDLFFRTQPPPPAPAPPKGADFGAPEAFVPQKRRVLALWKSPRRLAAALARLARPGVWARALLARPDR
ncbi:MAG TPA: hypothetical protein VIL46_06280 [Gemmataceae bacterium]